jgi:TorA maturation chaperone TorD
MINKISLDGGVPLSIETKTKASDVAFEKLAQISLARSNVFGLLAFAFFDPTPDFVQQIIDNSFISELNGYFKDLTARQPSVMQALDPLKERQAELSGMDADELLHQIRMEYARLFIGPSHMVVPPYETFYGSKNSQGGTLLMVSPTAMAVENAYREAGVNLSSDLREPPDHFATEMEFLYYLCKQESDAWAAGKNAMAKKWRRKQLAFLDGHLAKWGCEFCQAVEAQSTHPFYRAVAHFGEAFIQLEGSDAIQAYQDANESDENDEN